MDNFLCEQFASRLKALRASRGLTLVQLGDAVGATRGAISNLENMRKRPSLETAMALAEFFDVSLDYLTGLSNSPRKSQFEEPETKRLSRNRLQ